MTPIAAAAGPLPVTPAMPPAACPPAGEGGAAFFAAHLDLRPTGEVPSLIAPRSEGESEDAAEAETVIDELPAVFLEEPVPGAALRPDTALPEAFGREIAVSRPGVALPSGAAAPLHADARKPEPAALPAHASSDGAEAMGDAVAPLERAELGDRPLARAVSRGVERVAATPGGDEAIASVPLPSARDGAGSAATTSKPVGALANEVPVPAGLLGEARRVPPAGDASPAPIPEAQTASRRGEQGPPAKGRAFGSAKGLEEGEAPTHAPPTAVRAASGENDAFGVRREQALGRVERIGSGESLPGDPRGPLAMDARADGAAVASCGEKVFRRSAPDDTGAVPGPRADGAAPVGRPDAGNPTSETEPLPPRILAAARPVERAEAGVASNPAGPAPEVSGLQPPSWSGAALPLAPAAGPVSPVHAGAVSRQVADAMVEYRGAEARVVLEPEELGPVRLTVTVEDRGTLIRIVAERPETVELMRRHADLLLQDLAESGVSQPRLSFAGGGEAGGRDGGGRPPAPQQEAHAGPPPRAAPDQDTGTRPPGRGLDMRV